MFLYGILNNLECINFQSEKIMAFRKDNISLIPLIVFFREVPDFSVHILPRGEISADASQIHGIEKKSGRLVLRGHPIHSVNPYQGLGQFQNWILKNFYENSVVLVSSCCNSIGVPYC